MPRSKIDPAIKIQMVERCLSGQISTNAAAKELGVDRDTVNDWVRLYKTDGAARLFPTRQNQKYPPEVKLQAVKEYLDGVGSLRDISGKYGISSKSILQDWIKLYHSHGEFNQPNSGGQTYMAKGRKTTREERVEIVSDCIAHNKDYSRSVEMYGVSYQQIYEWVRKYEKEGVIGLVDRRGKRRDEASMSETDKLKAQLKLKEAENLRLRMENDLLKKLEELERGRDKD